MTYGGQPSTTPSATFIRLSHIAGRYIEINRKIGMEPLSSQKQDLRLGIPRDLQLRHRGVD